jgi:hypothetical protein
MKKLLPQTKSVHCHSLALVALTGAALLLGGCGGGSHSPAGDEELASGVTGLQMELPPEPDSAGDAVVLPSFHLAPVILNAPADADVVERSGVTGMHIHTQRVPAEFGGMSSRRLTMQDLLAPGGRSAERFDRQSGGIDVSAMASGSVIATYTPSQVRALYSLPVLPAAGQSLTASQAAQLGAGQTIYIVDARNDPNIEAELAAFNQKFALPTCARSAIAPGAALPLPAARATCELAIVYSTASATMSAAAPSYDSGWATEIALDVEWAHATAPLSRIVLIEAPDSSSNNLAGAIRLANAMGPGIVSMSFGAPEGSWTASFESAFSGAGMSYLASTGDSGASVQWPAVSPKVLAVGGTTTSVTGAGTRSEVSWSGTGGGSSQYTPAPSYQNSSVPGMGAVTRRNVADVAFNADPRTGQYLAQIVAGSNTVSWGSAGGTSLSAPQWAGIIAVANAMRANLGKSVLGAPHAVLYGQVAAIPANYTSAFADITAGSDGRCASCTARSGYDTLSGLGTPNGASLLGSLVGASATAAAPVVNTATISGTAGAALSFTVSVSAPNPVTYALSGAPAGMAINSSGGVTWASPVAGTFAVTVVVQDSKTGLKGQGVYTVTIAAPPAPVVASGSVAGKAGTALSFATHVSAPNTVTYSLSGAPAGMSIGSTGTVSWPAPLAGSYAVTVVAKDSKTGLTGRGVVNVTISAMGTPMVGSASISGMAGTALSFNVSLSAVNAVSLALAGAPLGMTIGAGGTVSWSSPVQGTYAVTVTARDSKTGLSGHGLYTVTIGAKAGPMMTSLSNFTAVAGTPFNAAVSIADASSSSISINISGAPMGMMFSLSGHNININWSKPVAGNYTLNFAATDAAGLSARLTIPVTITTR